MKKLEIKVKGKIVQVWLEANDILQMPDGPILLSVRNARKMKMEKLHGACVAFSKVS